MKHFNVLTEAWIPVADLTGKRKLLGILDTLEQAHFIKEISDTMPTNEYGIFRFLCAFLMDAYRPEDWRELDGIYEKGSFDMQIIQSYVEQCQSEGVSFDLFDRETPFLQTKYNEEYDKKLVSAAALNIAVPSGNNHIHFEHLLEEECSMTCAEAAGGLCAVNLFCTAGAQEYPSTVNGAPPVYFVFEDSNLFGSLVHSMLSVREAESMSYDDPPVLWRSKAEVVPKMKEASISVLYGMLYPCRRVLLCPEEDGTVRKMYFCQGKNYVAYDSWRDPHVSYVTTDKGRASLKPAIEKEPWRNITTIFSGGDTAPVFVQRIINQELMDEVTVKAYSISTSQASYLDMQKNRLRMPRAIAENETKRDRVRELIQAVEAMNREMGKCLEGCFRSELKDRKNHNAVVDAQSGFLQQCRDYILQEVFDEFTVISEEKASDYKEKYLEKLRKDCLVCFERAADELLSTGMELWKRQKMKAVLIFNIYEKGKEGKEK